MAKGDIAIDDVSYSKKSCASLHPVTTDGKFTCDFESSSLCGQVLYYTLSFGLTKFSICEF